MVTGFVAWIGSMLIGRTTLFDLTVEYIPAGGQLKHSLDTGKCKTLLMDKMSNMLNLAYLEIRIDPVIGPGFSMWLNKAYLFIFTNCLLRKVDFLRNFSDQVAP